MQIPLCAGDGLETFIAAIYGGMPADQYIHLLKIVRTAPKPAQLPQVATLATVRQAIEGLSGAMPDGCVYACINPSTSPTTRKRQFVANSRAFYADFDVGKTTQETSMADFSELRAVMDTAMRSGAMPEVSMLVHTGNGLHAYWLLDEWITAKEWGPVASALRATLLRAGLRYDAGITTDICRILRPPSTMNWKTHPPKEVRLIYPPLRRYAFQELRDRLLPPGSDSVVVPFPYKGAARAPGATHSELSAGITPPTPGPIGFVVRECKVLADVLDRHGDGDSEPLWNLALFAAAQYGEQARRLAHALSDGHAEYDQAKTDQKFDQKLAVAADHGWPSCASFSVLSSKCSECPWNNVVPTPLHLRPEFAAAPQSAGQAQGQSRALGTVELPPGYYRRLHKDRNCIVIVTTAADGKIVVAFPHDIVHAEIEPTDSLGFVLSMTLKLSPVIEKKIELSLPNVNTWGDVVLKYLGTSGVGLTRSAHAATQRFVVAFTDLLIQRLKSGTTAPAFGWSEDGFSFAGTSHKRDGSSEPVSGDHVFEREIYAPCGELGKWKQAADMLISGGRLSIQAIIASSFAAPLVALTGEHGLILSAYSSESGRQKTRAVHVAQSVWGHPVRGIVTGASTINSIPHRLGIIRNLPFFVDEVRLDDIRNRLSPLAFQFSQGVEKARLTSDIRQRTQGTWSTMLTVTSNFSVQHHVATISGNYEAAASRIFEFQVTAMLDGERRTLADASAILSETDTNHGRAGELYAAFVARNRDRLKTAVGTAMNLFEKRTDAAVDERFWLATAACLFVGAGAANALGLTRFDVAGLGEYLIGVIRQQRIIWTITPPRTGTREHLQWIIWQYIRTGTRNGTLLTTNRIGIGGGAVLVMMGQEDLRRMTYPDAQLAFDEGVLVTTKTVFAAWANSMGASFTSLMEQMQAAGCVTVNRVVWCAGTPYVGARVNTVHINLRAKAFGGVFDAMIKEENSD